MSIAVLDPDPLKDIADLKAAVYRLEQGRGGASFAPNGSQVFPSGVTIGEVFVWDPVPAPTGLSLTWGSDFDRIYIDAEWDAPVGDNADQVATYLAELVEDGVGVVQAQGGLGGTSYRFTGQAVKPNTDYEVRVWGYNRLGRASVALGPVAIHTEQDSSEPDPPTGLTLQTGIGQILASWNENAEEDVQLGRGMYELEISTSPILAGSGSFATVEDSKRTAALVQDFSGLTPITTPRYVHMRAIDSSGNFGPWSAVAGPVTPDQVQTADLANLAVTNAKIGLLAVNDANVNDLKAGKLTSDSITTAILTIAGSGMMRMGRTSSPFNYIIEDATGLRFYAGGTAAFTGGTLMMDLNVMTGNAFFGGSLSAGVSITSPVITGGSLTGGIVQTGTTGPRVELSPSGTFGHKAAFFGPDTLGGPAFIGVVQEGTGAARIARTEFQAAHSGGGDPHPILYMRSASFDNTTSEAAVEWQTHQFLVYANDAGSTANIDFTQAALTAEADMIRFDSTAGAYALLDSGVVDLDSGAGGRVYVSDEVHLSQGGFIQLRVDGGEPGIIGSVSFLMTVQGLGEKRLYVGVNDSGGTGRRALYMEND